MRNGDREEDQEGRIEYGSKTQSFSWSGEKDIFEYSAKVDGKGKDQGKNDLKEHIDFEPLFHPFHRSPKDKGTHCLEDHPICEDYAEGKFISEKRDEELPHEEDLRHNAAYPHDEQRDL